jgi:hypothetical protein
MKNLTQCKTITRDELVTALKPYPEYGVSQLQLNTVLPDYYIITGVDDRLVIYTKKGERPTFSYEQTDTPPEGTEEFEDKYTFLTYLIYHIENKRFNHFNHRTEKTTMDIVLSFALAIKDDFISEFRESALCQSISSLMGRAYDGYIPLQDGGYGITEHHTYSLGDSSYHFTKNQTDWGSREADRIAAEYRIEHEIPEDHGIDFDCSEFQEWEEAWCEDFRCQLIVNVTVPSDSTTEVDIEVLVTYGSDCEETLVDKRVHLGELTEEGIATCIKQLKTEVEGFKND